MHLQISAELHFECQIVMVYRQHDTDWVFLMDDCSKNRNLCRWFFLLLFESKSIIYLLDICDRRVHCDTMSSLPPHCPISQCVIMFSFASTARLLQGSWQPYDLATSSDSCTAVKCHHSSSTNISPSSHQLVQCCINQSIVHNLLIWTMK